MGAPVRHTCPNIDRTIKRLKSIRESVNDTLSDVQTLLDRMVSDVESELDDIESELEDLRSDNSSLRDWGTENEEKIKELEEELSELQSIVN